MRYFLILTLICLSQSLQANEIRDLHEFDGTTPILGLMDEPIAESFFKRDMQASYQKAREYRSYLQLESNLGARGVEALLINDYDAINAIIISAVDMDNKSKNFLVQVPAYEVMAIDATLLTEYSHVLVMSMLPYRVQLDCDVEQEGVFMQELLVYPPDQQPEQELAGPQRTKCDNWNTMTRARVTNSNGPSAGGSRVAVFEVFTDTVGDQDVRVILDVFWPKFDTARHVGKRYNICNPRDPNVEKPADYFFTHSPVTGRDVTWSGVGATLDENNPNPIPGIATCIEPHDPEFPCLVDTTGDGERDSEALWSVVHEPRKQFR